MPKPRAHIIDATVHSPTIDQQTHDVCKHDGRALVPNAQASVL